MCRVCSREVMDMLSCDPWELFNESAVSFGMSFPPRSWVRFFTCPVRGSRPAFSGSAQRLKPESHPIRYKIYHLSTHRLPKLPSLNRHSRSVSCVLSTLQSSRNPSTRKTEKTPWKGFDPNQDDEWVSRLAACSALSLSFLVFKLLYSSVNCLSYQGPIAMQMVLIHRNSKCAPWKAKDLCPGDTDDSRLCCFYL